MCPREIDHNGFDVIPMLKAKKLKCMLRLIKGVFFYIKTVVRKSIYNIDVVLYLFTITW